MTTHTVHHNPVRSDLPPVPGAPAEERASTRWALAGLGAGITGAAAIATSLAVTPVYDDELDGNAEAIAEKMGDFVPQIIAFHVLGMVSAILMIVFAAGLHRRLRAALPADSTLPMVAFGGLFGTAIVVVLGTGLDTEFVFAASEDLGVAESLVFYNHWIGTIPWVWGLVGLSGIVLFAASRVGAVAKWLGLVGLLGGGLTLLLGISPLQYMAGFTGPVGLIVVSLGFLVGDKAFRGRA